MERSEGIGDLAAALAKARAAFRAIGKDRTAKIVSPKGTFSYSYADLASVVDATCEALAANGLAVLQPASLVEGRVVVTTILAHASGQSVSERMEWPVVATDNRSIGSGITYARRHSLLAILGAAASDEDDDAEASRGGDHPTVGPSWYGPPPSEPDPALISQLEQSISLAKEQGFEAVQALAARLNAESPSSGPERERLLQLWRDARKETAQRRFTGPSAEQPTSPSSPSAESGSTTGKLPKKSSKKTMSPGDEGGRVATDDVPF